MPHRITRRAGTFLVYTQPEARKVGITPNPWRDVQPGQWALTDDEYVAQCLSRRTYTDSKGKTRDEIRLTFGRVWAPRSKPFCFRPFYEAGIYGGTVPRRWVDREARKTRTRQTVKLFVYMLLAGHVDWRRLGLLYRPDQKDPVKTVKKLFREEKIQQMVRDELRKNFLGFDLDPVELVRRYEQLREKAMQQRDFRLAKDILDIYRDYLV